MEDKQAEQTQQTQGTCEHSEAKDSKESKPTLMQRLQNRREQLTRDLAQVDGVITMLEANPMLEHTYSAIRNFVGGW